MALTKCSSGPAWLRGVKIHCHVQCVGPDDRRLDDVYDAADTSFALGCGVFGLGAVIDLGGNDTYTVDNPGDLVVEGREQFDPLGRGKIARDAREVGRMQPLHSFA